jgi:hypothetical protein
MQKETLWREIESLPESQLKTLWKFVQFLQYTTQEEEPKPPPISQRTPGLDADTTWVSDDFDDPLPDSFWLDNDVSDETSA